MKMSIFPNSPRLQKGALVSLDPFNSLGSVVVFQSNIDTVTPRLMVRTVGSERNCGDAFRLTGAPKADKKRS